MHPLRAAVEAEGVDAVLDILAPEVLFKSSVIGRTYRGRRAVEPLVRAAASAFQDFRYVREIGGPDAHNHALLFQARIGDRELEGCHLVRLDDDGNIDELVMMVRPLSAALALAKAVTVELVIAGGCRAGE